MEDADEVLLTALADRVRSFVENHDGAAVTSDEALSDARSVLQAVRTGRFDQQGIARALYLVAALHWARYRVLPPGRQELDYLAAKQFFGYIAPLSPERVPQPLWPVLGLRPAGDSPDDPAAVERRIAALAQWGAALAARCRHRPQPGDADDAVRAYREAVTLARTAGDPQTSVLVANLAGALMLRGFADLAVLDEVIALIDEELPGADERGTHILSSNLAVALRHRFQLTRRHDDLARSADLARRRVELMPVGDPLRAGALSTLAVTLGSLFEMTGRPSDLTAAVTAAREAVTARDADRMRRAGHLTNLGNLLRIRYEHYRHRDDLNQAITAGAEALDIARDHHEAAAMWSNYSAALRERFRLAGDHADLEAAIDAARHGLRAARDGSPHVVPCAIHLGCALLDRYHAANEVGDVREAVDMLRTALAAIEPEHRFYGPASVNLGIGLRALFGCTGDRVDLDAAVDAGRTGHATLNTDDPSRALDALNLGQSLMARFQQSTDPADAREAAALFREAAESVAAPAKLRLDAARTWADLESDLQFGSAQNVTAYRTAVELLPLLAWRSLPTTERENLVGAYAGLIDDAAAAATEAGRPEEAVELVEGGRAVLWGQWLATRGDLSEVVAASPELGAQLQALRTVLDRDPGGSPADPRAHEQRMTAAQAWEAAVTRARRLPGLSRFLRLPTFEQLRAGLPDGTTVVVTVSRHRCDALLLTRCDGVRVVRLPDLTFDDAYDLTNDLLRAHETADAGGDPATHEKAVTTTLSWLWRTVVAPVLAEISPPGPDHRVWWCPTGPLTLLPLHAASSIDGRESALDRVVASYTPTVRALTERREPEATTSVTDVLAVIQPATPGSDPLPNAVRELDALRELTGGDLTELVGARATRAAVVAQVAEHRVAHFSCHGVQDLRNPGRNGLAVHDGFLTVADLRAGAPALRGDLAFLSACKTAVGGVRLLDEGLTVAVALHHVGYRRVIGTLWSVSDRRAAEVSISVYRRIVVAGRLDSSASARALQETLRSLRKRFPRNPSIWASFVHIGV
ncbi:CHAT domain-containing protein [Micromonospora sp. DT201]|uniref:CHAT domain-containing tetratricopeptide repeat protein n=1 Tax=Micromonospora sp. DT201 TaxID=3393442 RepID=UPI003CF6DED6